MEESSVLVAELRRQKGFRYAPELKARVGAFIRGSRKAGKTWRAIYEELGLPKETVRRWSELPVESRKLQPVRAVSAPPSCATLVSPKGWRLEDVDAAVAAELVRTLARCAGYLRTRRPRTCVEGTTGCTRLRSTSSVATQWMVTRSCLRIAAETAARCFATMAPA